MRLTRIQLSGVSTPTRCENPTHRSGVAWLANLQLCMAGWLFIVGLAVTPSAWAEKKEIAVIYPTIDLPYRTVFDNIIKGIEIEVGTSVANYAVSSETDINVIKDQLLSQNIDAVIALGRQGLKFATEIDSSIGVVVGGVLVPPDIKLEKQQVVSLTPDPNLLFNKMRDLRPATKRIFVVYNPRFNAWLIELARVAASDENLELVTYQAEDVRSAVKNYHKIFDQINHQQDAIWLLQDAIASEERSILPLILKKSWQKNVAVFSSNFTHVRRGILFSLYPDNVNLGKSLAKLAQGILNSKRQNTYAMQPLRDVRSVGNLRAAKHLKIDTRNFDTTVAE